MSKPREFWILIDPNYDVQSWTHHRAYDTKQHHTMPGIGATPGRKRTKVNLMITKAQFKRILKALCLAEQYEIGLADAWSGKHGDWRTPERRKSLLEGKQYRRLADKLRVPARLKEEK